MGRQAGGTEAVDWAAKTPQAVWSANTSGTIADVSGAGWVIGLSFASGSSQADFDLTIDGTLEIDNAAVGGNADRAWSAWWRFETGFELVGNNQARYSVFYFLD